MAFNAFAAAWTGTNVEPASTKTIDGKKFYVISSPDELAWFAKEVNDGNTNINAVLNNDIIFGGTSSTTCSYSWTPIGKDSSVMFNGTFDGNGYGVYGMRVSSRFAGLFGIIANNGVVENLFIGASTLFKSNGLYQGGVVAINAGLVRNVRHSISNIVYDTLTHVGDYKIYRGGIAAINYGRIENAFVEGSLKQEYSITHRCYSSSSLEVGKATTIMYIGGICGSNEGQISVSKNISDIEFNTSHNTIFVSSSRPEKSIMLMKYTGGICGSNSGTISNNVNFGNIYTLHDETGEETIGREYSSVNDFLAGIVGVNKGDANNNISVMDSLNANYGLYVKSSNKKTVKSGVCALAEQECVNSYYDLRRLTGVSGLGKTTVEMQKDQFAWILNTTNGTTENSEIWSRYNDYPTFAKDTLLAIHKVVFNDGSNTSNAYTNYKGLTEISLPSDIPEGKAFAGWVNSNGELVDSTTVFTEDQTVTAVFKDWEDVVYSIRFLDEKGNVLDLQSAHSGETPVYGAATPTKKSTVAYTYTFKGWSPEIAPAVWHTDYTVMFDSTINQYKVSYVDYDGTELFSSMFDYGTKPTYSTIPKKTNTVAYLYSFAGWSPTVENVSGEAVYKAVYDSVLQKYSIEFKVNGETLLSKDYDYGSVPKYENATPTKPATKAYSYSFAGWEPEIAKVTKATSYTAKFDSSLNKYMVVFQNGAKVLQDSEIEYGKVPAYEGETPQKTSTAKYDYSFSSWSPVLTKVVDEATYTALFDSTLRSYEVSFVSEGETLLAKEYEYGTLPKFEGNEPSKKESKGFTYSFKGWNPSVAMVKDKAVYTAVFDSVAKTFVVTFMNGKDTLQSTAVSYGNTPEYKGKTPTKTSSDKYEFNFSGWSPKLAAVTEDAVYKAVFDSTTKQGLSINRILANNFVVQVSGMQVWITNARTGSPYALFDLQGHVVAKGVVDQKSFVINAENRGRYIVRIGKLSKNVSVK